MTDSEKVQRLDELFRSSKGKPVEWAGDTVWMAYPISVGNSFTQATILGLSFRDEPLQGICLRVKGGLLEVAGQQNDGMVLWTDVVPEVVDVGIIGQPESVLEVWNCWKGRFGERAAWLGSAGLIVTSEVANSYHFACSDGPGDADFTALQFDIDLR